MKKIIDRFLETSGITINGSKPYDIKVHDQRLFRRLLKSPLLEAGESYMDGWWSCDQLDELACKVTEKNATAPLYNHWTLLLTKVINTFVNQQTKKKALKVAHQHYDLDNELYRCMLGETMAYTCAYWANAKTLDEAQYNKFDLICRKIGLKKGERVLELGCGWGGFAKYASEHYGCQVVGVNISTEQIKYARDICEGLPIQFFLCDWRDSETYNPTKQLFDKVVSIGLTEHIGYKNYRHMMEIARRHLKPDGLFLLHTIGRNNSANSTDPWFQKYIFPNSMLPSLYQLTGAIENIFVLEDLHNFGPDYDKTLMAWKKNFDHHWLELSRKYDERFYRMWTYYLLTSAGGFRARHLQLWQLVLSPKGVRNGYKSCR